MVLSDNNRAEFEALLSEMEQYADYHHVPIINFNGRKVLLELVRDCKPHRILEIGTAIGYSALLMADNSADDIEIVSLELSQTRADIAQEYINHSPYRDRIKIVVGDAGEVLLALSDKCKEDAELFDFVFIDAAKGQYPDYFRKIQPMLAENAVVLADNVLFRGYVLSGVTVPRRFKTIVKRLHEYLDMVQNNPEFSTVIREDGDGLAVSRRILVGGPDNEKA